MSKQHIFKKKLLSWSIKNTREYSWRNSEDPWKILLLEVISQQTQLDRANKYYQKFIRKFPSPNEMSKATKREILGMWSGLGYNSRALRLHEASKILSKNSFDSIYPEFDILPGVGEYTKNALLSFAYNDKVITQDTNVLRVFSRFFGTKDPKKFIIENQNNKIINVCDQNKVSSYEAVKYVTDKLKLKEPLIIKYNPNQVSDSLKSFYETNRIIKCKVLGNELKYKYKFPDYSKTLLCLLYTF